MVRTRRLPGGLGARSDVLTIERQDGTKMRVTLRRLAIWPEESTPDHAEYEYSVLRTVEAAGVPAPRPLHLDAAGELFGCPSITANYLPGRSWIPHDEDDSWTEGLARAAFSVHRVTSEVFDLSAIRVMQRDAMRGRIREFGPRAQKNPLAEEVYAALISGIERIELLDPALVHGDFWAGNTIWNRRRFAGIIDWADAFVGDPRADIGECRGDLAMSHGSQAADRFVDQYERLSGARLGDLWFFDLYVGINALLNYTLWLKGYHDLGLAHLTTADTGRGLRAHLRRALKAAGA